MRKPAWLRRPGVSGKSEMHARCLPRCLPQIFVGELEPRLSPVAQVEYGHSGLPRAAVARRPSERVNCLYGESAAQKPAMSPCAPRSGWIKKSTPGCKT
jgi:hypothetical protein